MKKIFIIFLIIAITILGCGCAYTNETSPALSVVVTNFPAYDFARQITGGDANVQMLISPGSESHSYEPSPRDIVKIQQSDLFICVGGESDEWIDDILDSLDTEKMNIIRLMDYVTPINEMITEGMHANEVDHDHDEIEYDEHIWTSPKNAKILVQNISNELCRIDEKNKDKYTANTNAYITKIDELDKSFTDVVANGARKTLIFGDRFPFAYFATEYNLDCYAAFPGCSAETEPAAATVAFLINKVKEEKIPVVLYIEFSNGKMADAICEETGAKKLLFHSCHNVTAEDFENGITYLNLMNNNLEVLKEALG
ncbi:MAG: metal ABC transporter substrate-binding protein [Clostridia bacterium]|nr:metal ABC transporter substrate-binding protein [Clostridia bacterium]